ncbi:MAG TPA: DHA2 family efflux MFS transporter permease subunit [Ktedonobacteraceae bacterium]|jgi:DHA2 family multidrug resistance protein|nr:DHA2 family efflux MFS transporter permease subunit [Ktedonobacteraceae bacterium]
MQISVPASRQGGGLAYKWVVAGVVIFGIFMSVLDSTIVNIAIPRLQSVFGASLSSVQWVLTGYTLAQGVATPLTAFLSDRFGIKRFYVIALVAFTVGSALCGFALSLPMLIVFRILQGVGGAALSPLAITLLYREFPPEERGMAMGLLGVPILLAPALGPTLGGYIITFASWQLIFYINLPIGILGIILGILFLHESERSRRTRFDLAGFLLSTIGLALLLYGLSDASTDGWGSSKVLGCLIGGVLLLTIFVFVELDLAKHEKQPLLDLRVFNNRIFSTSMFASLLVIFALFGGLFLVPVYLQELRRLNAFQAGMVLLPQALASMLAVVVGGRLVDKIGVRAIVIPGLIILGIASWQFTYITVNTPLNTLQLSLIMRGLGIGLCIQPLMVSALAEIPPQRLAQASSVSTVVRFVGSSLGVAVLSTMVQTQSSLHYTHLAEQVTATSPLAQVIRELEALFRSQGASLAAAQSTTLQLISGELKLQGYLLAIHDAFWFTVALAIAAIVASLFVGSRKKAAQVDRPRTQEEKEEERRILEEAMIGG